MEWTASPRKESVSEQLDRIHRELVDHPGSWALVFTGGVGSVQYRRAILAAKGCETHTKNGEAGRALFARVPA